MILFSNIELSYKKSDETRPCIPCFSIDQDNLSRGNFGAISALEKEAKPGQLRFVLADIAKKEVVRSIIYKFLMLKA